MTIAIISDTHIGDAASRLVNDHGSFSSNIPAYKNFKEGILKFTNGQPIKYLVLLGDIMDFSINSINNSITIARPFFKQIKEDKLAENVVYIPGNHDKQVWDGLEWDTSIIGNLSDYRPPDAFARIQPAWITAAGLIKLEGIEPDENGKFGNIFLKGLFDKASDNPTIILAYPNLYIERGNETIIVTHGHMFETAWVLLSDFLHGVSGISDNMGLKELEEWNVPITSMICTGVGSAGQVSSLFYRIEREAYNKTTTTLSDVLDKVLSRIKDEFNLPWYAKMIPGSLIKKILASAASQASDPRSYEKYLDDDKHAEHFRNCFEATKSELTRLKLPNSKTVIFGHTHHPYSSREPYRTNRFPDLTFYNTGGWLKESEAEVFLIDGPRFESFRV